jgi:lipopolysaccharide transport system ATP-binding protein
MSAARGDSGRDPSRPGDLREKALQLSGVALEFRRRQRLWRSESSLVLHDISFNLLRGETLGVVGRNGCGKSSLLRVMAGILAPTMGTVHVAPAVSRCILGLGIGFREDLSGRDNAYLSAILQGCSREFATSNLRKIAEFTGLEADFDRRVSTYSSGMRARLGFATALLNHVDILFIDEVLAVGDGAFRQKAAEALRAQIRGDQTVVLVSHNLGEVTQLCDRVVWIDQGRCAAVGPADDVVSQYRSTF